MAAMSALATSSSLDLSRLPPFQLVAVDYEASLAKLLGRIGQRLAARGLAFEPGDETNPIVILAEEVAYEAILRQQETNDAGNQMTAAYGVGAALDHVGATYYADLGEHVLRQAGETDDRYRRRLMLAASARVPGSLLGYMFWALTLGPSLRDARALNHTSGLVSPGTIALILLGDADDDGPAGEAAQVSAVIDGLNHPGRKLGTDTLVIRAANRMVSPLEAVIELEGAGPDANLVLQEATLRLETFMLERHRVGAVVSRSSLSAALTVGGVQRVRFLSPATDLAPGPDGVVELSAIQLSTEVIHG
jgi:phage-related baseplate assembly protein